LKDSATRNSLSATAEILCYAVTGCDNWFRIL